MCNSTMLPILTGSKQMGTRNRGDFSHAASSGSCPRLSLPRSMQGDELLLVAQQGTPPVSEKVQLQALWFTGEKKEVGERKGGKIRQERVKENGQASLPPPKKNPQKTKTKKLLLHLQFSLAWQPDWKSRAEHRGPPTKNYSWLFHSTF